MRKALKIIFFIFTIIYFYRWLGNVKTNTDYDYITVIYWIFTIPWALYESSQLLKDDRANGTHIFRSRVIMMVIGGVILILSTVYLNKIHHI
jgi:uncharacterized membrane protein